MRRNSLRALLAAAALVLAQPAASRTPADLWPDYEIILWHRQPDGAYAGLPRLGYSGALVFGRRAGIDAAEAARHAAPLKAAGLRWYVENIATDFYAAYHRWIGPDRPVNWEYLEVQRRYRADPSDPTLFHRAPSLSDPDWIARIRARLADHARVHRDLAAPGLPLFLNLGDEPGIADLSAFWDFDTGPQSVAGFREWLRGEYGTLAALNAQWGTAYATWEEVQPETTDAALARDDGNLSAWSDFKAWMDLAFARAVAAGREAVNEVDPRLLGAISGGQRPGWGGWDYALLAPQVDVLEGGELALAGAFHPGIVTLSTSFRADAREWHVLWRQVLDGARGTVIWDEARDIAAADGTPGPRGLASVAAFAALRGGVPAQLLASEVEPGRVGILYSQASFRLRWLLDRREEWLRDGASWAARGEEVEHLTDGAWRTALRRAARAVAQQGVTPRFLTPTMLAAGVPPDLRVLILPHAIALSDAAVAAIGAFTAGGGVVLADAEVPGLYDGRGRPRAAPPDLRVLRHEVLLHDLPDAEDAPRRNFAALLRDAGAAPPFRTEGPAAAIRAVRTGAVRLVAVQREAGAAGWPHDPAGSATIRLEAPAHLRLLGAGPPARRGDRATLTLDPVVPSVLVVSPAPLPRLAVTGGPERFRLGLDGPSPAAAHVLRVELLDPEGASRPDRGWNPVLRDGAALDWTLPAGAADRPGHWTLRVTDLLGGDRIERIIAVMPSRR